jgi:two-component system sensor histidine kinase/response regulator
MTILLWLHVVGLFIVALVRGYTPLEGLFAVSFVAVAGLFGSRKALPRRLRSCLISLGLLGSSAVLVHLTDGLTESHFHFFVMVAVITLYQDWLPFLVAVGFTALHHGIMGILWPTHVFSNPDAQRKPILWGLIHAGYVLAAAAANLYTWRLAEDERLRADEARSAEVEVRIARDDAIEVSRLKSQFLATMSHEIRTPMNGVIGLTGLLLNTPLDDTQRQYAEGVQMAGDGLLTVINDILDYSKLEAGKVDIESIELDPGRLIEDVAGLVAPPALSRGLELIAYCHPDVPLGLRGDTGRIRQVLINLTSNAIKFTHSGEVVIRVHLVSEDERDAVVRFEVSDTGIGIAPEDRGRLFEPFAQADATTTRRYGGTGLGLAISVRLVTAMGSTLELDSEPGRGSTFSFDLTLEKAPLTGSRVDVSRSSLADLRALVVDDNATNRWILSAQLESWQMCADLAEDAKTALVCMREAAAAGRPYALAILDMHMPGMDGVDLARAISSDPNLATTRLVLLTSGGDVDAETAAEVGLSARLTKPVRQAALQDQLLRLTAPAVVASELTSRIPPPRKAVEIHRGHVLVVEDNKLNQLVAEGMLVSLGYTVDIVGDGLQAVAAVSSTPTAYAAVLMDCHMPEMDGFEATEEIRRRQGESRHIPIIAMTASALVEDRDRCMAAGMDDFVAKPVDPRALDQALARWSSATPTEAPGEPADDAAQPAQAAAAPVLPTAAAPGGDPVVDVLDADRILALRKLGPADGVGLLPVLARVFLDDIPARLGSVEQAVAAGDAEALRQAAHQLKGAAANVGANAVAAVCAELEAKGRSGATAEPVLVSRLATDLDQASQALEAALAAVSVPAGE